MARARRNLSNVWLWALGGGAALYVASRPRAGVPQLPGGAPAGTPNPPSQPLPVPAPPTVTARACDIRTTEGHAFYSQGAVVPTSYLYQDSPARVLEKRRIDGAVWFYVRVDRMASAAHSSLLYGWLGTTTVEGWIQPNEREIAQCRS